jgi:hypothetical protein
MNAQPLARRIAPPWMTRVAFGGVTVRSNSTRSGQLPSTPTHALLPSGKNAMPW